MGMKADQEISLDFEGLLSYLRSKTRVFMDVDGHEYYVTHTDGYWRVQDCERLNDKGRFVDCSELVTTLPELVELPWLDGKSVHDLTDCATFYESIQEGWVTPDGVEPLLRKPRKLRRPRKSLLRRNNFHVATVSRFSPCAGAGPAPPWGSGAFPLRKWVSKSDAGGVRLRSL